jgi:hypothetical protein
VVPIVGLRPLSGRTGTTLLMNLLGTSPAVAFDRRYPAEYRVASYVVRMAERMTEPFTEGEHPGVTAFFFGPQPAWGPLPFASEALDVDRWRPALLSAMWASASEALLAVRPNAQWYAEKLAVDETPLREAGIEVLTIDLVRDPRDVLASRRAFTAGGTEDWARDARVVAAELTARLDELDARPPDLRLRYEDLVGDLEATAQLLAARLDVDLDPRSVDRPAEHVTTPSAAASVGRWRRDLSSAEADDLSSVAERLGY